MNLKVRSQRGLSMVEALIAIAILGIVVSIVASAVSSATQQQEYHWRLMNLRLLESQVLADVRKNAGKFPPVNVGGARGKYVLCFNRELLPTLTDSGQMTYLNTTNNPVGCQSAFMAEIQPKVNSLNAYIDGVYVVSFYFRNNQGQLEVRSRYSVASLR